MNKFVVTVTTAATVLVCLVAKTSAFGVARRSVLQNAVVAAGAGIVSSSASSMLLPDDAQAADMIQPMTEPFKVYQVFPDASAALNPTLSQTTKQSLLKSVVQSKRGGVLWLGEHHNSGPDHVLQEDIIRSIHAQRTAKMGNKGKAPPMALGLEQVQVRFQSALDQYIAGAINLDTMRERVEWDKRWQWPFEVYEPVFKTARQLGIQLVALNVDSEHLAAVEKDGLPGLSRSQLSYYIPDAQGFADFAKPTEFGTYVDYVIRPSYNLHKAMGLLKYTISGQELETEMSFRNFFSGRILWDEAMATRAFQWTDANPGGLMIGVVGADHVKFQDGIPGRYQRMAGSTRDCTSVLLNPTLIDTRPPGSVSSVPNSDSAENPDGITLQLRYVKDGVDRSSPDRYLPSNTGGVLPLADFIVIS